MREYDPIPVTGQTEADDLTVKLRELPDTAAVYFAKIPDDQKLSVCLKANRKAAGQLSLTFGGVRRFVYEPSSGGMASVTANEAGIAYRGFGLTITAESLCYTGVYFGARERDVSDYHGWYIAPKAADRAKTAELAKLLLYLAGDSRKILLARSCLRYSELDGDGSSSCVYDEYTLYLKNRLNYPGIPSDSDAKLPFSEFAATLDENQRREFEAIYKPGRLRFVTDRAEPLWLKLWRDAGRVFGRMQEWYEFNGYDEVYRGIAFCHGDFFAAVSDTTDGVSDFVYTLERDDQNRYFTALHALRGDAGLLERIRARLGDSFGFIPADSDVAKEYLQ